MAPVPGEPCVVTLKVNGKAVAQGTVPAAMSLHFTSNATFDIGRDLDSPVSLEYFDKARSRSTTPSAPRRSRI